MVRHCNNGFPDQINVSLWYAQMVRGLIKRALIRAQPLPVPIGFSDWS